MKVNIDAIINSIAHEPVISDFFLGQNYPYPFNPTTTIQYHLPKAGPISLKIYNLMGQEVATLVDEKTDAGKYKVEWHGLSKNGLQAGTGLYVVRMVAGEFVSSKKLLFLK